MTDLGTLGGAVSAASGVNDAGQVVGFAAIASGDAHAFRWESGRMTDLGTLGGRESRANAINRFGVVAGTAVNRNGMDRAVRWVDGRIEELGTLGGEESFATDINDAGQIAGSSSTTPGAPSGGIAGTHAFLWDGGAIDDLGSIGGGDFSWANGVNEAGHVVGQLASRPGAAAGFPGAHAFVWAWGTFIDLGTLGGERSEAYDVNNLGEVVGVAFTGGDGGGAAVWAGEGVLRLPGENGRATGAIGINDAGQIVGYVAADHRHTFEAGTHAVLWSRSSGPRDFEPRTGYATPAAAPTVEQADLVVELGDIYVEPETISIPAETDVQILLKNVGLSPHNFSIDALGISVDLEAGESTTITVSVPAGEYRFRCNVPGHTEAGQVGTLVAVGDGGSPPTPTPVVESNAGAPSVELAVEMADILFVPAELTVHVGAEVTILRTNGGVATHNFTIAALGIASGDYASGEHGTVAFTAPAAPGDFEYSCDVPGHREAGQVGILHVTD